MTDCFTLSVPGELIQGLAELVRQAVAADLDKSNTSNAAAYLDVDAAAGYLASTPSAIRSLVKRNAIPHHKAPNGRLLFERHELDAWVRSR